jgi:hypothetical protein
MRPVMLALMLIGASTVPLVSHAEIYKWVDERGVINYANKPPPNAGHVTRIDENTSNLSIIPTALPRTASPQAGRPPVNRFEGAAGGSIDRATLDQLERSLTWRERCFAERRVSCSDPTAATFDHTPAYAPPVR